VWGRFGGSGALLSPSLGGGVGGEEEVPPGSAGAAVAGVGGPGVEFVDASSCDNESNLVDVMGDPLAGIKPSGEPRGERKVSRRRRSCWRSRRMSVNEVAAPRITLRATIADIWEKKRKWNPQEPVKLSLSHRTTIDRKIFFFK
jgi:hypothetical protein